MATITELDPILVKAWVPFEVYVDHLELLKLEGGPFDRNQIAERVELLLTLPSGDKYPNVGKIAAGGYEFDPQTQVMEVMAQFRNPKLLLRPGLNVTLQGRVKSN